MDKSIICSFCRNEFKSNRKNVKYCSELCKIKRRIKYQKEYYLKNKIIIKEKKKRYLNTPEAKIKRKDYIKKYIKKRYKEDILFQIKMRLRSNINAHLKSQLNKKEIKEAKKLINFEGIIEHLKPFPKNIKNLDIEHILPISKFNLKDKKNILILFHPFNHWFLNSKENQSKGTFLDFLDNSPQKGIYDEIIYHLKKNRKI